MANNLQTINNQFSFNFPIDFVPQEIENRYLPYLKAKRKVHSTVLDYLNSTILDISFPSLTFNTISNKQILKRKQIDWKAVDNIYDLFDKSVTLNISDVDSHINYFILLDILTDKYVNTDKAYDENIVVTIVDENRNSLYQIQFRDVMWTNLSDIKLAYNQHTMGGDTFSLSFTYNWIDIKWIANENDIIQN